MPNFPKVAKKSSHSKSDIFLNSPKVNKFGTIFVCTFIAKTFQNSTIWPHWSQPKCHLCVWPNSYHTFVWIRPHLKTFTKQLKHMTHTGTFMELFTGRGEGSYRPNFQTNFDIFLHELCLNICNFINTTASTWADTRLYFFPLKSNIEQSTFLLFWGFKWKGWKLNCHKLVLQTTQLILSCNTFYTEIWRSNLVDPSG